MDEEDNKTVTLDNTREVDYGRVATRLLFKQHNKDGKEDINEWRERFVAKLDPTEYEGGVELVGSWSEWERFKRNWPSFQRLYLNDWLDEIEVRLRSLAIRSLAEDSVKGNSASSKFLAEGKYKEKKAGRPTKEAVMRQTKIDAQLDREIANDAERLGL
jgi:hypothetical protein